MPYRVVERDNPHAVMAIGFYGEAGREKAERMIAEGYWNRLMPEDRRDVRFVVATYGEAEDAA